MSPTVGSSPMYVVLGASGNTGSISADFLLTRGSKVRVVGRDAGRLRRFVRQGAEAFTADLSDAAALRKALSGAHAVHLSSYGAQVPAGTGPVTGLHSAEQKLNAISDLNVLHLRPGYFMENNLAAIDMIRGMGIFGHALLPDLKLPMIATRDIGDYAARRLLDLDFSGKQTFELLGQRDLSIAEATALIARGIGKPDLRYEQLPYDRIEQALTQMGFSPQKAAVYIEMFKAINAGVLVPLEVRSPQNTTPTTCETFVQDVFAPAYRAKASAA